MTLAHDLEVIPIASPDNHVYVIRSGDACGCGVRQTQLNFRSDAQPQGVTEESLLVAVIDRLTKQGGDQTAIEKLHEALNALRNN